MEAARVPAGPVSPTNGRLRHPEDVARDAEMADAVLRLRESYRPPNTQRQEDNKMTEFFEFVEYKYPNDAYKYNLNSEKVHLFMFYQAFREKKKKGGTKEQRSGPKFSIASFEHTMSQYQKLPDGTVVLPNPDKPAGPANFDSFRHAIRKIYKFQVANNYMAFSWDHVWSMHCDQLFAHVKERVPQKKKETYQEKVDSTFQPYLMVDKYNEIEEELWNDSVKGTTRRSVCAGLRHHYNLLHSTSGILRFESITKAEISDFQGFYVPKKDTDVHPMFLMINQIAQGKTNKGRVLYGRATRHRDVRLCCIAGLSFYLMMRFFLTSEFTDFTVDDWLDNSKWFDVKLLVDTNSNDYTREMKYDSYGSHLKKILVLLSLAIGKLLHLGRNIGSKILDLLEEESEAIRRMGQWNPSVFDNSYSSKLPLSPIRKLAGFDGDSKIYFLTRGTVMTEMEYLKYQTPIGKWAYTALEGVTEAAVRAGNGKHQTAFQVLKFLTVLNECFLQDAAAMMVLHPERANHPIFDLDVFRTTQFEVCPICFVLACT